MSLRPIGSGLAGVLAELVAEPEARARVVKACWRHAVGETVARRTRAVEFSEDVLTVEILDSGWEGALRGMSAELVAEINATLGASLVRRIEWRAASVDVPPRRGREDGDGGEA